MAARLVVVRDGATLEDDEARALRTQRAHQGGELRGRVCAPNGSTWLANASVCVDTSMGPICGQTDANGRFSLAGVPVGTYTVHVAAGSFTTDFPGVQVRGDEITDETKRRGKQFVSAHDGLPALPQATSARTGPPQSHPNR